MEVLVIGGTNFIGPHVVALLHRLGHQITVYHRGHHEPDFPADVRHIHSPQASIPVLHFPRTLARPAPDIVLHMFPVGEQDARAAMHRFAGFARRIVALSSGDVYQAYGRLLGIEPGTPQQCPLDEDAQLRLSRYVYRSTAAGSADWKYHYEKILVEQEVLGDPGLPGTVLRLPAVYGPGDPYHRFRPYIKRMQDGRTAILLESAVAAWRWTHDYVENVAHAIVLAVLDESASGRVYNVGEAETPTVAERVRQMAALTGWKGKVVSLATERVPAHLRAPYSPNQELVLDSSRIRRELGFQEVHSLSEGLERTIEWERAQPPISGDPDPQQYAAEDAALL
jgi:nucleoside-diphosphate-sugar epimerase